MGRAIVADVAFFDALAAINRCAVGANVRLHVTSSFRDFAGNDRVCGVCQSNHLIGHAIDMNVKHAADQPLCGKACLAKHLSGEAPAKVAAFLDCVRAAPGLRWGGTFDDPVHIDDGTPGAAAYRERFERVQSPQGCAAGTACVDGVCEAGGDACANGVQDGGETDVDCGGPDCPPCADGKRCFVNGDCQSNGCDRRLDPDREGVCRVVQGACGEGQQFCLDRIVGCNGNFNCQCFRTLSGTSICVSSGRCHACTVDGDCDDLTGPGSRCMLAEGCSCQEETFCAAPCPTSA